MTGFNNQSGKEETKTREELIEECLEIGIPVTGYEDQETLKMFLGSADDDYSDEEEDDEFDDDGFDEEPDDEMFDEDFDFDEEDEDDDLFEDDESSYN
jgi:hypothetical protein